MRQVAYQALPKPGFCSMKCLGEVPFSMHELLVYRRVTPSSKFSSTHLQSWVERGTARVECLAQEHNI